MNQPSAENVERATAFLRNDLGLKAYNQDVEMLASLLDAAERRASAEITAPIGPCNDACWCCNRLRNLRQRANEPEAKAPKGE